MTQRHWASSSFINMTTLRKKFQTILIPSLLAAYAARDTDLRLLVDCFLIQMEGEERSHFPKSLKWVILFNIHQKNLFE